MSFITDAVLTGQMQGVLQQPSGLTGTFWATLITFANTKAYNEILRKLAARGYSKALIDQWDGGVEFQTDLGIFWTLTAGSKWQSGDGASNYNLKAFDRRTELHTVLVTIAGKYVPPDSTLGGVNTGLPDTSGDIFVWPPVDETNDPAEIGGPVDPILGQPMEL